MDEEDDVYTEDDAAAVLADHMSRQQEEEFASGLQGPEGAGESRDDAGLAAMDAENTARQAQGLADAGRQMEFGRTPVGVAANSYMDAAQQAAQSVARLDARRVGPNRMYEPTQRAVGQSMGALDMQSQGAQQVAYGTVQTAALEAAMQRQLAAEMQQQAVDRQAMEAALAAREEDQLRRMREATDAASEATQRAIRASRIDPSKAWAKRGVGMRIIAALGAALKGDTSHIQFVIDREVEAQKANADIRFGHARALGEVAGQESNIYARLLERTGNERVATEALRLSQLEAAKYQMQAMLMEAGIPVAAGMQMQALGKIDQEIAGQRLRLERLSRSTSPYVSAPLLTGAARKYEEAQLKNATAEMAKYPERRFSVAQEEARGAQRLAEVRAKATIDAANSQSKMANDTERTAIRYLPTIEKLAPNRERLMMAQTWFDKFGKDAPGVGFASRLMLAVPGTDQTQLPRIMTTEDMQESRRILLDIVLSRLRQETGAAYNEQEYEDVSHDMIGALDDEQVFRALKWQMTKDSHHVNAALYDIENTGPEGEAYVKRLREGGDRGFSEMTDESVLHADNPLPSLAAEMKKRFGEKPPRPEVLQQFHNAASAAISATGDQGEGVYRSMTSSETPGFWSSVGRGLAAPFTGNY